MVLLHSTRWESRRRVVEREVDSQIDFQRVVFPQDEGLVQKERPEAWSTQSWHFGQRCNRYLTMRWKAGGFEATFRVVRM